MSIAAKRRQRSVSGVNYDDVMIPVYTQHIREVGPFNYEPYGPLKATRTKEPFDLNLGHDPEEDLYYNARAVVPSDCEIFIGASRDKVRGKVVRVYFHFSPEDSIAIRQRWEDERVAKKKVELETIIAQAAVDRKKKELEAIVKAARVRRRKENLLLLLSVMATVALAGYYLWWVAQ